VTCAQLASRENLARLRAIASRLGLTDLEVARIEAALELVDDLDELTVRRLVRRLRAGEQPGVA